MQLYNTLTREKEAFVPHNPESIGMYVCGPTVYDRAHLGNARSAVAYDLLYRTLRRRFGQAHVRYVRNITDVDDKINAAAKLSGTPIAVLTEKTTARYREDMRLLGCLPPDIEPAATGHIAEMLEVIAALIARGNAYEAEGHVLFSSESYAAYGSLSGRSAEEMLAGARVETAPFKRSPGDFVLWKPSAADEPGWPSPYGYGRPGWHIECTAMSVKYLGPSFDIHGGGVDLLFPHHENECAQAACAFPGHAYARRWVHNGFLRVNGEKMSKSLGNFITLGDVLDGADEQEMNGAAVRLALLSAHYRKPLNWKPELLQECARKVFLWRDCLAEQAAFLDADHRAPAEAVVAALEDDVNAPAAGAEIHALYKRAVKADADAVRALAGSLELCGFGAVTASARMKAGSVTAAKVHEEAEALPAEILQLAEARAAARAKSDWAESDRLRAQIESCGFSIKDGAKGSKIFKNNV